MKFLEVVIFKDDIEYHKDFVGPYSGPAYGEKVRTHYQKQYPDKHVRLRVRLLKQIGFPPNEQPIPQRA